MSPETRREVCALVFASLDQTRIGFVFDYQDEAFHDLVVEPQGTGLNGFNPVTRAQFGGTMPDLYHYGRQAHIRLAPTAPDRYEGYDHATQTHFVIQISGRKAQIYDYDEARWFDYGVDALA